MNIVSFSLQLACVSTLTVGAAAQVDGVLGGCPGGQLVAHGRASVEFVPNPCWTFETDDGSTYSLLGFEHTLLTCPGVTGTLAGCIDPQPGHECGNHSFIQVRHFQPDTFEVHGTSHFLAVEGGCWAFVADDGTPYEPGGAPPEMLVDGATGLLTAISLPCVGTTCQVGAFVQVVSFVSATHWTDLGAGLSGSTTPVLRGEGQLAAGQTVTLTLTEASPSAVACLVVGFVAVDLPFRGGVLVPAFQPPHGLVMALATDLTGSMTISQLWPAGVPAGLPLFAQYWIADSGGPSAFSASNAVRATTK